MQIREGSVFIMNDKAIMEKIDGYYDSMIETLKSMVNIDSGMDCPEGIHEVATIIGRLSSLQNLCTRLIFVPFEPEKKADV